VCTIRWKSWSVVSCLTAMTGFYCSRHWTLWPMWSTVHGSPVSVRSSLMRRWERVLHVITSSVSSARWPTTASHRAASQPVPHLTRTLCVLCFCFYSFFRSKLLLANKSTYNKAGLSVRPSIHTYIHTFVRPQKFCDFTEIWCVGRGRWVIHDGMPYDLTQGQGHGGSKFV